MCHFMVSQSMAKMMYGLAPLVIVSVIMMEMAFN